MLSTACLVGDPDGREDFYYHKMAPLLLEDTAEMQRLYRATVHIQRVARGMIARKRLGRWTTPAKLPEDEPCAEPVPEDVAHRVQRAARRSMERGRARRSVSWKQSGPVPQAASRSDQGA